MSDTTAELEFEMLSQAPWPPSNQDLKEHPNTVKTLPPFYYQAKSIADMINKHFGFSSKRASIYTDSQNTQSYLCNPLILTVLGPIGGGRTSFVKCIEAHFGNPDKFVEKSQKNSVAQSSYIGNYIIKKISAWDMPRGEKFDHDHEMFGLLCHIVVKSIYEYIESMKSSDDYKNDKKSIKSFDECYEKMSKAVYQLRIGRPEAAQAAIAFADDAEDYCKVFSEKLLPTKSFDDFKNGLQDFLSLSNKAFLLVIDDLDMRRSLMAPLLRIVTSFRDFIGKLGIIICGEPNRIADALSKVYHHSNSKVNDDSILSSEVPNALRLAVLGHEIRILPWTSSRQIAFLTRPKILTQKKSIDGRLIWAWFLAPWFNNEPNKEELLEYYNDLIYNFIKNDVTERTNEKYFENEADGFNVYKDDLNIIMKPDEIDNLCNREILNELLLCESCCCNKIAKIFHEIINILRNGMFPTTPLETVAFTNILIDLKKSWVIKNIRPAETIFDFTIPYDRWIRFFTKLAWNRWQNKAIGRIMEEDGCSFFSGLSQNILVTDCEKILIINNKYTEKHEVIDKKLEFLFHRLTNWTEQIESELSSKINYSEKRQMYNTMNILLKLYNIKLKKD